MFFMMGVFPGRKDIEYRGSMTICDHCGSYGRLSVYMTYMVLSLFFIPCFKWNRRYYVQTSCCDTIYELDADIGKRLAKGEDITIRPEHLTKVQAGYKSAWKRCSCCGYSTQDDFEYCPKCGQHF